jgi:hypothetical protein
MRAKMCIRVSSPDPDPKKITIETTRRRNLGLAKVLLANMCIWVSAPDPEHLGFGSGSRAETKHY